MALVNSSDLVKFANSLARSVRSRLAWSTKLRGQVRVSAPDTKGGSSTISVTVAAGKNQRGNDLQGMARAFELGSGIHGKKRRKYKISPYRKPYLMFPSRHAPYTTLGRIIRVSEVWHPGVKARPFLQPAIDATKKKAIKELGISIRKNARKTLSVNLRD
jgi:hypothetical protein